MKKQRKQLITMLVLLAFLIISYFIVGAYNDAQAEKEIKEDIVVTDFDSKTVVAFSYDYEKEMNSFTKLEDVWSYDKDPAFDVDESLIDEMLDIASNILAKDYFSEYETIETYGLDAPQKTVSLTFSDGSTMKLMIGDYNEIVGYYYLMVEGDSNLYLVDATLLDEFELSYADLEVIEEVTENTESVEDTTEK